MRWPCPIGFSRVFVGWDFLGDLILIAVIGHGVSYADPPAAHPSVRRHSGRAPRADLGGGLDLLPGDVHRRVPAGRHLGSRACRLPVVRDDFQSTTPPVEYVGGWAFLAGATLAATVWLADTFAFRAQARGEALVPGAVLFVFVAALGVDDRRMIISLAVVGAGFCALALLRLRLERRPRTVLGRPVHPLLTTIPAIACAAAVVLAGAWAVGPNLPGAGAEPLFDTHNSSWRRHRGRLAARRHPFAACQPSRERTVHGAR